MTTQSHRLALAKIHYSALDTYFLERLDGNSRPFETENLRFELNEGKWVVTVTSGKARLNGIELTPGEPHPLRRGDRLHIKPSLRESLIDVTELS